MGFCCCFQNEAVVTRNCCTKGEKKEKRTYFVARDRTEQNS